MTTLFDRYLLVRYWHAYVITFVAILGLYVVIDAFTNLDEFTRDSKPTLTVMLEMSRFYLVRTSMFFNLMGSLVTTVAAMLVLAVVQRHGELNPILSAGIPTYRLALPIVWATVSIDAALVINQELIIPRIAHELQMRAGVNTKSADRIKPTTDFASQIMIMSGNVFPKLRKLANAEFVLPPDVTSELSMTIRGKEAYFHKAGTNGRPAGWLVKGADPAYHDISLTPLGQERVLRGDAVDELFIVTDISFDHLANGNTNFEFLSTVELIKRVKNPTYATASVRSQSMHLHNRFTRLLMNVIVVLLIVPLIVRKESRSLIISLANSLAMIVTAMAVDHAFQYLGSESLIPLDMAAWGPVVLLGTLSAWFSELVRT